MVSKASSRTLDVALEATPGAVPEARRAVSAVAVAGGAKGEVLDRISLAVSEAVTNAVVHAYGDSPAGSIQLLAAAAEGELSVLVADDGCGLGQAPQSPGLGLGMGVIEYSVDSLAISTRASGGTIVEMRFSLSEHEPKAARAALGAQLRGSVASAMTSA
jgi:anti-sigma regulatory factor (Ser/Thr protein kinase)